MSDAGIAGTPAPTRASRPCQGEGQGGPLGVIKTARRIADDPRFQPFVLGVIVVGAIVIGVETSATLTARYGAIIVAVETMIQAFFVAEILIRVLACWPKPAVFFRNGWNAFDFAAEIG